MGATIRHWCCSLGFFLLAGQAVPAVAADPEEQARALIGIEYANKYETDPIPGSECRSRGGGFIELDGKVDKDWSVGEFNCGKRLAFVLERFLGREDRVPKWRIVDAVLAPVLKKGVQLHMDGDCELDGKIGTTLRVLVRMGKRDRVDHRSGVLAAWTVDLEAQKIVPVSTRRIVCYRPTPP